MEYISKQEALRLMREGKKVSHIYFTDKEYMMRGGKGIVFGDGNTCTITEFFEYRNNKGWQHGYFIKD